MICNFLKKIDRFFPTPKFLSFDLVSVDITPRYVRIMKLKKTKRGLIPDFYKEVKLKNKNNLSNFNAKQNVDMETFSEIVEVLRKLKNDFNLNFVISSLPETNTYIYRTDLPKESASDLASAIRFNLEENVPLRTDDINFDYFVMQEDDRKNQNDDDLDVVVSVFPKDIIALYTKIFKEAGLFPVSFQSEAVSLSRAVVRDGDNDAYLLLRFLKDQINVGVVEDGAIQYASIIQADTDKIINNFASEEAEILNEALNKILIFWFTSKKDLIQHKKIETALITGDYALSDGLKEFLERKLKINIDYANVWSNCFSLEDYIPEIKKEDSLRYPVSIGLAIKGVTHE